MFMLKEYSFFDPSDRLPSFELECDLMAVDGLGKVEVDVPFDGVSCEVEWFVELYEGGGHC